MPEYIEVGAQEIPAPGVQIGHLGQGGDLSSAGMEVLQATGPWECQRIRAGPLTKELRMIRPRYSQQDTISDHRDKAELKRHQRTGLTRSSADRLELMLALIGPQGTHYSLTYDDEHLPSDFQGVRRCLRAFLARVKRHRHGEPLYYIPVIEGLHGDHRYHIHFVCNYEDLSPTEIQRLWGNGKVDDEPVLRYRLYLDQDTKQYVKTYKKDGGFRRLAEYFHKERTDGIIIPIGRHPWSCARCLRSRLSEVERWRDVSGEIDIPEGAIWSSRRTINNDFGCWSYGAWISGLQ